MTAPVRIADEAPEPLRIAAHDTIVAAAAEMRPGRRWLIVDTDERRPLTVNDARGRMHHMQWAARTGVTRGRWHYLAAEAGVPRLDRARFTVLPLHKDRRSPQDPAACAPEWKAALDGLVDGGVLEDDAGEFVAAVTFLPPLRACGHNGLAVLIEEAS